MPLPSYRVLSPVYIEPPPSVIVTPKKIAPEYIKSMQFEVPTVGSYAHAAPTVIVTPAYVVSRTANKRFLTSHSDFLKNGYFSQQDDYEIEGMKSAGEDARPNLFDYVNLPARTSASGVMESLGEMPANFTIDHPPLKKYVHDLVAVGVPNNEVGKRIQRIENLRQHLKGYLTTIDANESAKYLMELGYEPENIDRIGEGFLPERAIYGVARLKDGKVLLAAAEDAYEKVAREAKFFGVDINDLMDSMFNEEIAHIWRGDIDKEGGSVPIELKTKQINREHYRRLVEKYFGTHKLARRYAKLAEILDIDIATTPERYGRQRKNLEVIIEDLKEKARILGKDETEYVSAHLPAYMEDYLGKEEELKDSKYENSINKSEHRSIEDLKEMKAKAEKVENNEEAAETPSE